ncbi:uncharacterized protein BDZ83DRAFT_349077 [Colletotrichum acutatum]|uniref:Uncharacterized protein n=1 Tax=Glomerella acutata TaxID=27357 RepID=A0AAD8UP39_GLOAC|nr:uncharacterized protein BDZ83DRAFT_349077 [Colletotrichum acutatum]KAK1724629.1 hypothetical protein BDZ83DRAFT_349077 [Colletotrichum acutatum]
MVRLRPPAWFCALCSGFPGGIGAPPRTPSTSMLTVEPHQRRSHPSLLPTRNLRRPALADRHNGGMPHNHQMQISTARLSEKRRFWRNGDNQGNGVTNHTLCPPIHDSTLAPFNGYLAGLGLVRHPGHESIHTQKGFEIKVENIHRGTRAPVSQLKSRHRCVSGTAEASDVLMMS